MVFGKDRTEVRHLRVGQPEQRAHGQVASRSLNHAKDLKSKGLEPSALLSKIWVAQSKPAIRRVIDDHAGRRISGGFEP